MENLEKTAIAKQPSVMVEKLLNHPVSRVWEALTDKDQMQQWYFTLDDFKAEKGFEFRFPGQGHKGENYLHICRITEIIPEKKLQYSWQYEGFEGYSVVTFELFEVKENKTRLVLTHHGLESFPSNNPDFAASSFNEGWNHLVNISLPEYLDKKMF